MTSSVKLDPGREAFNAYTAGARAKWAKEDAEKRIKRPRNKIKSESEDIKEVNPDFEHFLDDIPKSYAYIYFIVSDECKKVKIGVSRDLSERLKALKTGCPTNLRILGSILTDSFRTAQLVEKKLHKEFKEFHSHGEWFHYNDNIKKRIKITINQSKEVIGRDMLISDTTGLNTSYVSSERWQNDSEPVLPSRKVIRKKYKRKPSKSRVINKIKLIWNKDEQRWEF